MKLVTAQEMKEIDKLAIEKYGVPGIVLMDAAAKQVADVVTEQLANKSPLGKVVVLCGGGNNGGDGFGAARWLHGYGIQVKVFLLGTVVAQLSGDAAAEAAMLKAAGVAVTEVVMEEDWFAVELALERAAVVVDAILGTGFSGELRPAAKRACQLINQLAQHVVAVDVPTGVNADDGSACADAVQANVTVTMALPKTGLLLYPGKRLCGSIVVANIGMPSQLVNDFPSHKYRITEDMIRR